MCIRFAQERALYNTDAEMMEVERGDTPFVLAGLAWCPSQAREQLDMHASMNTSLSTRRGQHDRLMCSQAAARQWSFAYSGYQWLYKSWAVAFDGCACRGAMASIALPHVSTENDRQINLSQRVLSMRCERSTFASL